MGKIEKIEFFLDGVPKGALEEEDKRQLLVNIASLLRNEEFLKIFPEIRSFKTFVFALIDSIESYPEIWKSSEMLNEYENRNTRFGYIKTDVTSLKKILKIAFPIFYNCTSNVSALTMYIFNENGFEEMNDKSLGISLILDRKNDVKLKYLKADSVKNIKKLNDVDKIVIDYLLNNENININYKEGSSTINEIINKNKLRENNFNVLKIKYAHVFEMFFDEDNNEFSIKNHDMVPYNFMEGLSEISIN